MIDVAHAFLSRLSRARSGASSIEYAVIVAMIGIALSLASVPLNNALNVASATLDTGLQIAGGKETRRGDVDAEDQAVRDRRALAR